MEKVKSNPYIENLCNWAGDTGHHCVSLRLAPPPPVLYPDTVQNHRQRSALSEPLRKHCAGLNKCQCWFYINSPYVEESNMVPVVLGQPGFWSNIAACAWDNRPAGARGCNPAWPCLALLSPHTEPGPSWGCRDRAVAGTHLGAPRWSLTVRTPAAEPLGATRRSWCRESSWVSLHPCPEHSWWAGSCKQHWAQPGNWRYVAVYRCSSISREKTNGGCDYRQCFAFLPWNVFVYHVPVGDGGRGNLGGISITDQVCLSGFLISSGGQEGASGCCRVGAAPTDRVAGTRGSSLADTRGELRGHGLVLWIPDLECPGAAPPRSGLGLTCVMSFLAVTVASKMFSWAFFILPTFSFSVSLCPILPILLLDCA